MKTINFMNLTETQMTAAAYMCADIGLVLDENADITVTAERGDTLSVCGDSRNVKLTYRRDCELWRALSYVPAFIENEVEINESAKYEMLCYMADNSRNAVYNIPTAKQTIRALALMGYDSMMLYTEDTYELPDYPYFGHMRGRFTEAELKELDDYAYMFGIELIPCIQTLAHLSTALRWPDFDGYKDDADILLVGDERTYKFVEAAIAQCRKCFRSKNLHIGMDEAMMLGCGEYLKKNGYKNPSDVMIEHLERVVPICHKYGFEPMIWSDMFFHIAFGKYRIAEGFVPQEVADKVPDGLALVYWDYYSMNRDLFSHMLDCHNRFKNPVYFAGGAWKWYGFGAHNAFSLKSSKMQLDECEARGVNKIIVTSWGDNGAEASQFSAFASVLYFAERCYTDAADDRAHMNARGELSLGISFDDLMAFDLADSLPGTTVNDTDAPKNPSKYMLYSDPFERLVDRHIKPDTAIDAWKQNAEKLMELAKHEKLGYAFETLGRLCRVLTVKGDMGIRLYDAYTRGDRDTLANIANNDIPFVISELEAFIAAYRRQWYRENKTFGFITQEIRLGGLKERMASVKLRLDDYLAGNIDRIEELEYEALPISKRNDGEYIRLNKWNQNVGAGIV